MTAPRPKRTPRSSSRTLPADVQITDVALPEPIIDTTPTTTELIDGDISGGIGTLTIEAVVQVATDPGYTPPPESVDEFVNQAMLEAIDNPNDFAAIAKRAIEGIHALPAAVPVAPPLTAAQRQEEHDEIRNVLDSVISDLPDARHVIQTAVASAGRNAPYGQYVIGEYRADNAGVITEWTLEALATVAARNAAVLGYALPGAEAINSDGGPLYNGPVLDQLAADHRRSVGQ